MVVVVTVCERSGNWDKDLARERKLGLYVWSMTMVDDKLMGPVLN